MSISDGFYQYLLCRKMENMRPMKEEMDGKVFFSHQSWHFSLIDKMNKVLFQIRILNRRENNYVPSQGRKTNRENESVIINL